MKLMSTFGWPIALCVFCIGLLKAFANPYPPQCIADYWSLDCKDCIEEYLGLPNLTCYTEVNAPDQCCEGTCREYVCVPPPDRPGIPCPDGIGWYWHGTRQHGNQYCSNGQAFPQCHLQTWGYCISHE